MQKHLRHPIAMSLLTNILRERPSRCPLLRLVYKRVTLDTPVLRACQAMDLRMLLPIVAGVRMVDQARETLLASIFIKEYEYITILCECTFLSSGYVSPSLLP